MGWDEAFADRYEEWSADSTADIGCYVEPGRQAGWPLAELEPGRQAGGPLAELAAGNGRVAIPVAQATGLPVIGIGSSPKRRSSRPGPCGHGRRAARPARG